MTVTVIDAFADRPFAGNPAAVCVLREPVGEDWMRALAAEMNLAETAFVTPSASGAFGLRWLTPTTEVDLCGHATLASAHLLYETGELAEGEPARFDTRSGRLTVRRTDDGTYTMDFPATPPVADDLAGLAEAFGVAPTWTGRTAFDGFAVLDSEAAVREAVPDSTRRRRARRAGRDPDRARRQRLTVRCRLAVFCPELRRARGPGDRLGALRHRPVLGGKARAGRGRLLPGIRSRRTGGRPGPRRPRRPDRPGRHRLLRHAHARRPPRCLKLS